jgi:hypothetical protein
MRHAIALIAFIAARSRRAAIFTPSNTCGAK